MTPAPTRSRRTRRPAWSTACPRRPSVSARWMKSCRCRKSPVPSCVHPNARAARARAIPAEDKCVLRVSVEREPGPVSHSVFQRHVFSHKPAAFEGFLATMKRHGSFMRRGANPKLIVSALIGVLAVTVFSLTGRMAWQAYDESVAAKRVTRLNSLTDKIIFASSIAAVERGMTSVALGAAGPADASLRRRIDELRGQVDTAWREILAAASSPVAGLADDPDFSRALDEALRLHETLLRARKRVDADLGKGSRDIGRAEWIETISRFIEGAAG